MIEKDIFTSQKGTSLYEDAACWVASMMMLLKHINFNPLPSWEELCNSLCLAKKGYMHGDPEIGLYPEDLFRSCLSVIKY